MTSGVAFNGQIGCRNSVKATVTGMFSLAITSAKLPTGHLGTFNVPCLSTAVRSNSRTNCCPNSLRVSVGVAFSPRNNHLCKTRVIKCGKISGHVSRCTLIVGRGKAMCSLVRLRRTCTPPFSSTGSPMTISNCITKGVLGNGVAPLC